jgi:hypothetical protein
VADLIRSFTGHSFCGHCGSEFYSRKSVNRQGVYVYYQCGCRQRRGPDACAKSMSLRLDKPMDGLREVFERAFADCDSMVDAAPAEAREAAGIGCEVAQLHLFDHAFPVRGHWRLLCEWGNGVSSREQPSSPITPPICWEFFKRARPLRGGARVPPPSRGRCVSAAQTGQADDHQTA